MPVLTNRTGNLETVSETINIDIGPGELLDRRTILQIKASHVTDPLGRQIVRTQLNGLDAKRDLLPMTPEIVDLERQLKVVNSRLWSVEDDLRICETNAAFGPEFVELARSVYKLNDERARLKGVLDQAFGALPAEIKVYAGDAHQ